MTREQVIEKTTQLIEQSKEGMLKNLNKVINDNLVEYEDAEDNYLLPKKILCALLREESFQYKPHNKIDEKEIDTLYQKI